MVKQVEGYVADLSNVCLNNIFIYPISPFGPDRFGADEPGTSVSNDSFVGIDNDAAFLPGISVFVDFLFQISAGLRTVERDAVFQAVVRISAVPDGGSTPAVCSFFVFCFCHMYAILSCDVANFFERKKCAVDQGCAFVVYYGCVSHSIRGAARYLSKPVPVGAGAGFSLSLKVPKP